MNVKKAQSGPGTAIDVSIIIVSWNARDYLLKCLASIDLTRSDLSLEIIVVDNASVDGSPEAVARDYPNVCLIQTGENLGFAKGNNVGIARATGRYLALVNSDVVVMKDCFQNLVQFMDDHPDVGMAGPRILNPDMTLQISCRRSPSVWCDFGQALFLNRIPLIRRVFPPPEMIPLESDPIQRVPVIYGMFWMVSRKALEGVGSLDPDYFMYGEDMDWCKRFHSMGWGLVYCPGSRAIHFGGASSSVAPARFFVEKIRSRLLYFHKHHGRVGSALESAALFVESIVRFVCWSLVRIVAPKRREVARVNIERHAACICFLLGRDSIQVGR